MTEWEMLRYGREDEALQILQAKYQTSHPSTVVSLGVGCMWTRRYEQASHHFRQYLNSNEWPKSQARADICYAFSGIAIWCMGDFRRAIATWKASLRGFRLARQLPCNLPILLTLASALRPTDFSRDKANRLLDDRIANANERGWPLPIAKYLRGKLNEAQLEKAWREPLSPNGLGILSQFEWRAELHRWECAFHESFVRLSAGKDSSPEFRARMQVLADTSRPEWATEKQFSHLIRKPEFFLARCEAERDSGAESLRH